MTKKPYNELMEAAKCYSIAMINWTFMLGSMIAAGELLIRCKAAHDKIYGEKGKEKCSVKNNTF